MKETLIYLPLMHIMHPPCYPVLASLSTQEKCSGHTPKRLASQS
jgi:hypothetical protein